MFERITNYFSRLFERPSLQESIDIQLAEEMKAKAQLEYTILVARYSLSVTEAKIKAMETWKHGRFK